MDGDQFDTLARKLSSRRILLSGIGSGWAAFLGLTGSTEVAAHNALLACRRIKNRSRRAACLRRARRHNASHATPPPPGCTPSCAGRNCGSDGCSGTCGSCGGGSTCVSGTCRTDCTPSCAGRECGGDGCGGSCGSCSGNADCLNGTCRTTCTPSCAGKNCGSNGCGGSCGTCSGGRVCSNPANGGICQCPAVTCAGTCCGGGQQCFGVACWPDNEELAFVTLINNHRAANGNRPPLTLQNQLGAAAELHSQDQAATGISSHTGSDGSSIEQRFDRAGYQYSWWGENIYYGGPTAAEAFNWWRGSTGHNDNMLSTNFTQLGIGRAQSPSGTWYWTTTFGRPV